MSEPRALPIAVPGDPRPQNERARLAERDRETATWEASEAARCSEFKRTGRHWLVLDDDLTFFCGSDPWIGRMRHCIGTRRWVDRFGQHDFPCVISRFPGERRGSRGRKAVSR